MRHATLRRAVLAAGEPGTLGRPGLRGVLRGAVLHVGDDVTMDVMGAAAAGLAAVWLRRPGLVTEALAKQRAEAGAAEGTILPPAHIPVLADLHQLADQLGGGSWTVPATLLQAAVPPHLKGWCGWVSAKCSTSKCRQGVRGSVGGEPRPMAPLPCKVHCPRRSVTTSGSLLKRTKLPL